MLPTKSFLTILLLSFSSTSVLAQSEDTDTILSYNLEEVTVEAPKVIRKADMDVYHPSQNVVAKSATGLQLLTRLSIPSLSVDEVMGRVTSSGTLEYLNERTSSSRF